MSTQPHKQFYDQDRYRLPPDPGSYICLVSDCSSFAEDGVLCEAHLLEQQQRQNPN